MFASELAYHSLQLKKVALRVQPRILHVDSSHGPTSVIAHGARAFFAELKRSRPDIEVDHVQLWDEGLRARMEYNLDHVQSKMAMLGGSTEDEHFDRFQGIESLCAQAATACGLVISAPMWNYGAPYVLKQYFDCVLHPGLTFKETASGPQGLLGGGRSVVIITSAGGAGKKDYLTPWLTDVATMMGFDSSSVVAATNVAHGSREEALSNIARDAAEAAKCFQTSPSSDGAGTGDFDRASAGSTAAGESAGIADNTEEDPVENWDHDKLLSWLRARGGISEDGLESVAALRVNGELWLTASEDDWRSEELGLEESDVSRLVELQKEHLREVGAVGVEADLPSTGPKA